MITFAGFIAALLTVLAGGFGTLGLLIRRRLTVPEYLALAWLLGTAVNSILLWLMGLFCRGSLLEGVVAIISIALGWAGFARWRRLPGTIAIRERAKVSWILATLFLFELAAVIVLSLQHTLGWDGLTVWELKARYSFFNNGVVPISYFSDTSRWFSHPEYPLLLPLTETWFYLWMGDCDQYAIKLLFPIWYAAGAMILRYAAQRVSGRRWVGWMVMLLFPLVPAIHNAPGGISVGYADLPLGAVYLAAIFYLLVFLETDSSDALRLCIALGATLPWMKREGVILWGVLAASVIWVLWRQGKRGAAVISLLPGLCLIVGWKLFLRAVKALPSRDFAPVSLQLVTRNVVERVGPILREFVLTLRSLELWDIFWIAVVLALFTAALIRRDRLTVVIGFLLAAPMAFYLASYFFSAWPSFIEHMDTSLPRLLMQLTPVGWLVLALVLRADPILPTRPGLLPASQSERGTDYN